MKVTCYIYLKHGYYPVMSDKEEKEVEITLEVPNMVTAQRMIRQILSDNVIEYDFCCEE